MGELMVNPGAIKKNTQDIGDLSNLTTTEKSSLVGAVNELDSDVGTLNTKLSNYGKTISSGSMRSISESGLYYLTSAVTDKPVMQSGYGGTYLVFYQSASMIVGLFVSAYDNSIWSVTSVNNTWTYSNMSKKTETVSTYSESGNTDANVAKIWKIYDASLGYCLVVETRDGVQKKIKMDA